MMARRRLRKPSTILSILLLAHTLTCALGGCTVVTLARGDPGVDLSLIASRVDRESVELRLREPIRVSETSKGIMYAWYLYDGGVTPSAFGAFGFAILDLITVFMPELSAAMQNADTQGGLRVFHHYEVAAVAYDSEGRVVGVFPGAGEYSVLPEEGRPPVGSMPSAVRPPVSR